MLNTFCRSVCAGVVIAIGGSVFLACDNRYVGAVLFSVALLSICYQGYVLFTGKVGYLPRKHGKQEVVTLLIGLVGNLVTTFLLGRLIRAALPALGETAASLGSGKLTQNFFQTLIRAVFCGVLMYLAVEIFREKKTPLGIVYCIPVFILSGFEHSIADMFYFGASGLGLGQIAGFMGAVLLGNSIGGMLLPLLEDVGLKKI